MIKKFYHCKAGAKAGRNPGRHWLGFVSFSAWLPLSFLRFLEKQGKKETEVSKNHPGFWDESPGIPHHWFI